MNEEIQSKKKVIISPETSPQISAILNRANSLSPIKPEAHSLHEMRRSSTNNEIRRVSIIPEEDSQMNFKKWTICLISFGIMLISTMVCYLGIEAASYGFEKVIVDKALIFISVLIFIFALITLISTLYAKINVLIFIIYMNLVMVVFIAIFAIGCLTFSASMESWIYENWGEIRNQTDKLNIQQFYANFQDSLISLGFFSFTISIGLIISNIAILFLISFKRFLESVISSFSLIFIVFSSATIIIAFQTQNALQVWFQISDSDEWVSEAGIVISFIWTFVGCFGYYASLKSHKRILSIYLACMIITNILLFALGVALIVFSFTIEEQVADKWNDIRGYLLEMGYEVPIVIFTENLDQVVKFAGLYSLAFFIFNTIGITASSYQMKNIEKNLIVIQQN